MVLKHTAIGAALALLAGCSVIGGGAPASGLPCRVEDGIDPCPAVYGMAGARCSVETGEPGVCETQCVRESCNGIDDDCDGTIDEGEVETCNEADDDCDGTVDEGIDFDEDGFNGCRSGPGVFDCDDGDADVRPDPSVGDACDGIDNDCDPATRDGATQCDAETQECDPIAGCVEVNCGNRPGLCADDQFCDRTASPPSCRPIVMSCLDPAFPCTGEERCDPTTGQCELPRPNDSACDSDAQCQSNLCFPVEGLRLNAGEVGGGRGLCTRSCCRDTDCDAGELCWQSGSGVRACVAAARFDGTPFGAPTVDSCGSSQQCGGQECRAHNDAAQRLEARVSTSCGPDYGDEDSCGFTDPCFGGRCIDGTCEGNFCFESTDCPSGLCVRESCRRTCRSWQDCPADSSRTERCLSRGFVTSGERVDVLSFCEYVSESLGTNGASCTAHGACVDDTCVTEEGDPSPPEGTQRFCADACCSDAQCDPGYQCRPIAIRGQWEGHCLPRPRFGPGRPITSG